MQITTNLLIVGRFCFSKMVQAHTFNLLLEFLGKSAAESRSVLKGLASGMIIISDVGKRRGKISPTNR